MKTGNLIKISAVITAIPRWTIALIAAEGLALPDAWRGWWVVFSALSAAGMALVEGVAFAYVFSAWRSCKQPGQSRILVSLTVISAALFVCLLTPSIAANVRGLTVGQWIDSDWLLTGWSAIVAGSTISIVASVGYSEKTRQVTDAGKPMQMPEKEPETYRVTLPETAGNLPALAEPAKTWRQLSAAERQAATALSVAEIVALYHVSERTARNWRAAK